MIVIRKPEAVQFIMAWLTANGFGYTQSFTPSGSPTIQSDGCDLFWTEFVRSKKPHDVNQVLIGSHFSKIQ